MNECVLRVCVCVHACVHVCVCCKTLCARTWGPGADCASMTDAAAWSAMDFCFDAEK